MPSVMRVHRSNRAEALVELLAQVVREPAGGPTEPECIVVQGRGMERWLSMELAKRLGVWANPSFPFPRRLVERGLQAVLGDEPGELARVFEPETLLWSIAEILPALLDQAAFDPIRSYLDDDRRGRKKIQLAERIADTFDHYTVYRPQMVLSWEEGRDSHWQAMLWRALVDRHGAHHLARRSQSFFQRLRERAARLSNFPRRLCLFGVSTLPPLYLEVLGALSRSVELHLFLLSPSEQYWADIRSRREAIREVLKRGEGGEDEERQLHLTEGNPLLASLGRLGRDFQHLLEAETDYLEDDVDLYCDPGTATMLASVQSDILNLRARRAADPETAPLLLDPADRSIAVHACHSAMREVEVLHDQLLALFEEDPTLQPHEIVVMTPSIEDYAPFIEAVFRPKHEEQAPIPYRIADRSLRVSSEVVDAFLTVLSVLPGRMNASSLLDLLGIETVRARFGIEAGDLDLLRRWITESGVRWGVDAEHREEVGQPALFENTWRFGLDRLLLGYALPGANETLFEGVLPYDDVEGTTAQLLGRLASFCETLFGFRRLPAQARGLDSWRSELGTLLAAMIEEGRLASQHQQIRDALATLEERASTAGFTGLVEFDSVRRQLERELQREPPSRGFLAGGVTFCELVPMRTIPFRIVCLLGMNDTSFPRIRRPLSFDLIPQNPLRGDRSQRDDDRYLFLEALLSAREKLLVTYVGQSVNDNSPLPPSVVVSELLDTLGESYRRSDDVPSSVETTNDAVVDHVVVRHSLQPFSPSYFRSDGDPRLFSFDRSQCEAARAMCTPRRAAVEFITSPLPEDENESGLVEVDDLVRFFENPSRFFLQRRLGIYLGKDIEVVSDREPLELDPLERWKIATPLLEAAVRKGNLEELFPSLRAEGHLPIGAFGERELDDVKLQVETIADRALRAMDGPCGAPVEIDAEIDDMRIVGVLPSIYPKGLVHFRYSKIQPKYELKLWLQHLLLNWVCGPSRATLIGRSPKRGVGEVVFRPVDDPVGTLRPLLQLFREGLRFPLPLFPQTSQTYAEQRLRKGRSDAEAVQAAREKHTKRDFPDGADAYVRQIYGTTERWHEQREGGISFAEVALRLFGPLFEHREDLS